MEKPVNNSINCKQNFFLVIAYLILFNSLLFAQTNNLINQKKYIIADITVQGETVYSAETIITYSGLTKGEEVTIPGGVKISSAIKKLWDSNLFDNIDVFITKVENNDIYLQIRLDDLPELKNVKVLGVKKSKVSGIIEENKLNTGVKVTENLITTTKNYLENKYRKDGFLKAKTIPRYVYIVHGFLLTSDK